MLVKAGSISRPDPSQQHKATLTPLCWARCQHHSFINIHYLKALWTWTLDVPRLNVNSFRNKVKSTFPKSREKHQTYHLTASQFFRPFFRKCCLPQLSKAFDTACHSILLENIHGLDGCSVFQVKKTCPGPDWWGMELNPAGAGLSSGTGSVSILINDLAKEMECTPWQLTDDTKHHCAGHC